MRVFRIEREKYLDETLLGVGASVTDANRWNSANTFLVYTSESRALAILEISVHLDLSEDLPTDRYILEIDIPEKVPFYELDTRDLPKRWDSKPPSLETQFIGDDFVRSNEAAVLKVPSAVIPEEFNFLINPAHPDSASIRVLSAKPLRFDQRLKRSK